MTNLIESSSNSVFKKYLSLTNSKGIKKENLFLLSGKKLVQEFLKHPYLNIEAEIHTPDLPPLLKKKSVLLAKKLFHDIDVIGTDYNILVLQRPEIKEVNFNKAPAGLEVVCPLGDPGNLGAIARSCLAFGIQSLILTAESANPFLPKTIKASAGAILKLNLLQANKLAELPENMVALDANGKNVHDFRWTKNTRLIVGEEGPGIGQKKFSTLIKVPTQEVESLNAVVAASIAMYDYKIKTK